MATVYTETFEAGNNNATVAVSGRRTVVTGTPTYTTDALHGTRAMLINAVEWIALNVSDLAGVWRLRTYVKFTGTISNHHLYVLAQSSNNTTLGDFQLRNFSGSPRLYNRYNFAADADSYRDTTFAHTVWRRIDYEWRDGLTCKVYIYDPNNDNLVVDTLEVTLGNAGNPATRVLIGNGSNVSGLTATVDSLALTNGEDPGPFAGFPATSPTVTVMVSGVRRAATVKGVMVGGVLQAATIKLVK